ncbi:MAG: MBOAT family protein [Bdellovibrionota bacterium]|nr:MAG: MBOAT family protein [Bdellovibrionota bacterium]
MVFSSFTFVFVFLPFVLGLYFVAPRPLKNTVLVVASVFFYAWGAPEFVALFLVSTSVDYGLALLLSRYPDGSARRRAVLWSSIVLNTGLLLYFKYANFFVAQFREVLQWLSVQPPGWENIALPIGISFFTFHKISYIVDVYRGTSKPARSFIDYILYISLFPQLIAGPIIRYHEIDAQLVGRTVCGSDLYEGMRRFILGLSRKVLLANPMGAVADNVFQVSPEALTTPYAWIGALAYAFQIYFDFSGYSDMAIGLARMFGFRFPENFDRPYVASSFTEFWRRWHMSLSRWMRDYLYVPLGGNRGGTLLTYRNLWIVFLLSGLWHGANWTFIVWGLYHGLFLVFDRTSLGASFARLPYVIKRAITFVLVCFGWVLFRSDTLTGAGRFIQIMLCPWTAGEQAGTISRSSIISDYGILVFMVCAVFCVFLETQRVLSSTRKVVERCPSTVSDLVGALLLLSLFVLSMVMIGSGSYSPFIYFQF